MTDISPRKMLESPVGQAETEIVAYKVDTSVWGSLSPTSPLCYLFVDDVDYSTTHLSGSASIAGTTITTKAVINLKRNKRYRLVVEWTDSGNHFSAFCEIIGEKP